MRHIPSEDSQEYDDFFAKEIEKCEYGVTINGVYIHGWLYWHLNHWNINVDYLDIDGSIKSRLTNPHFRDTEWLIAESLHKAEQEKKGLMLFGSRQLGKSETEASYIGRAATLFQGSQNVIASGTSEDTALVTSKIDRGLSNMHPYFRFDKLKFDWTKRVELGYEEKKRGGRRFVFSEILIRNFDEGRKTEALAGITPTTLVLDEIGKALKHGSIVYAEDGEVNIENVKIGDRIYDDSGKLTEVIGVYPQGEVDLYQITFADNRKVSCCGNHLWKTYDNSRKKWVILNTHKIYETNNLKQFDKRYNKFVKKNRYYIPINKCIDYKEKDLPIDPYLLGFI